MEGLKSSGIEFILTKYENCAGFMAEGGYHADGAPGILVATLGPGVANAVNVVANAFQDRVPMFFITGCVDEREAMTYTHQIIDHSELLKAVTKASIKIGSEDFGPPGLSIITPFSNFFLTIFL